MTPGLVAVRTACSEASRSSNYNENSCAGYRHELESDTWRIPKLSHPHALFFIFKVTHSKDRGGICHVQVQSSSKRGNNQRKRLLWLCVPPRNRFRWQNVEGRLPSNASSYRSRLTPAVIRCSGVAARWGQSVECRLQTLPLLPDRKRDQVLSRGKGCSTQSLPYTVSHRALHEPTVRKQFRFQLNSEFTPNFLSLATDSDEPGPANGVFA